MKVFLSNPPWIDSRVGSKAGARFPGKEDKKGKRPVFISFPFFLAYAAAVLKENKIKVNLVDSVAEGDNLTDFLKKIIKFKPDLVLIESSTSTIDNDLKIAKKVKEKVKTNIILAGTHMFKMGVQTLKENSFVDYGIFGEYEYTLLDLAKAIEKRKKVDNIKGLIHRKGKKIRRNKPREIVKNIDKFPFPDREDLPLKNYYGISLLPSPQVQVIASRGCPFKCIFCAFPFTMFNKKYRIRDPIKVVDEVEMLVSKYKFKNIYFFDDSFPTMKWWIKKFTKELDRRKIKIIWAAQMRGDNIDRETLKIMKEHGFVGGLIGIESGSPEIQKNIDKNLDLNEIRETMKLFHDLDLKAHLTFTIGLPGETKKTIKETLKFVKELKPYSSQFSLTVPFPGTKYFDDLEKKGLLLTKDWEKYDGMHFAVMRTEKLTAKELFEEYEKIKKEWYRFNLFKKIKKNKTQLLKRVLKDPWHLVLFIKRIYKSYK